MHNQYKSNNLKVLVPLKKIPNPYAKIKIRPDHHDLETKDLQFITNPYDQVALEAAVNLKNQNHIDHIIAVSIGNNCDEVLIQALARGADQAIAIETKENSDFLSPLNIAKILKYLILEQGSQLILLGKQSIDYNFGQTGPMLSGLLNWPLAYSGSQISFKYPIDPKNLITSNSNIINVDCETELGITNVDLNLPAIITVNYSLTTCSRISLSQLLKAKNKPFITIPLKELINKIDDLQFNQINSLNISYPIAPPIGIKINNIKELIEKLTIENCILT